MPTRQRVGFPNGQGIQLAAALELPDRAPRAHALFAHCFTCGKDNSAATRISRTLAADGIAVLRFDFTGLGGSEGDFANTNFSSNVDDLVAAADFLRAEHRAPALLVGHSLGGTGVLVAAHQIPEVEAVVTIGAPATPDHVVKQFGADRAKIEAEGEAEVSLAGRAFRIQKQFLEDLERQPVVETLPRLKRALLVFHAPFDEVVSIDQAGRIFGAAKHPKSFVSLHGSDHLLTSLQDAEYVGRTIAAWASRYLPQPEADLQVAVAGGEVVVSEGNKKFLREVSTDDHSWLADEPKSVGGDNLGPDPYEHLLAALGTCTSMTLRMYANRKGLNLEDVSVTLSHDREYDRDCEGCDEKPTQVDLMRRVVRIGGDLSDDQRARLLEIADRCPVHRTLEGTIRITTESA